jgi:hypothetical protein
MQEVQTSIRHCGRPIGARTSNAWHPQGGIPGITLETQQLTSRNDSRDYIRIIQPAEFYIVTVNVEAKCNQA